MSGRGTIKAGTYGGRRFREKQKKSEAEQKQLKKDIGKAQKERAPKSKQIRQMPKKVVPGSIVEDWKYDEIAGQMKKGGDFGNTGGGRPQQRVLEGVLGRGGKYTDPSQSTIDRARDIQRVVNTMPLVQDQRYLSLIRQEVEQRNREANNPDIDFEVDDDGGWDVEDENVEQAIGAMAEAGIADEEGNVEYGTADPGGMDGFDEIDNLGLDPFADPVAGDEDDDDDEDYELPPRPQASAVEDGPKPSLAEKLEQMKKARRDKARASGDLSVPAGEKSRVRYDPRIAEQDPEWQRRFAGQYPATRGGPGADASTRSDKPGALYRGLAPGFKHPTKYPSDNFERDARGNIKTKKVKTITAKDAKDNFDIIRPNLTAEAEARLEGKTKDLRYPRAKEVEKGARSRVKKDEVAIQGKIPKRVIPLGEGPVRDPRTRKIKTDRQGNPKMEQKTLTIAPREKPIEELWGFEQKGMSRDESGASDIAPTPDKLRDPNTLELEPNRTLGMQYQPPHRDPYEALRAVSKAPKARATKAREAETKHALYIKSRREEDPNFVPRGHNEFQYGAGKPANTRWFDQIKSGKEAILKSEGARTYQPEPINRTLTEVMDSTGDEVSDAEFQALKSYERIQDPPMAPMQQNGGSEPINMVLSGGTPPLPPGVEVSDAQILRNFYLEQGRRPDERFIAQQTAYQTAEPEQKRGIDDIIATATLNHQFNAEPGYPMYQDGVNEASMTGIDDKTATLAQRRVVDALPEQHKYTKVDGGRRQGLAFVE